MSIFSFTSFISSFRDSSSNYERLIKEKEIHGLYHFTDLSNLKSILDSEALLSRIKLKENGIFKKVVDSASNEIIKRRESVYLANGRNLSNYVPLYFARKSPMLYVTEGIKDNTDRYPHTTRPVYLTFDPVVITQKGTLIADGNASSTYTYIGEGTDALEKVDMDCVKTSVDSIKYKYSTKVYREIKRKKQAETLAPDRLNLKFLKMISFRSRAEMKEAERLMGSLIDKYNYGVVSDLFHRHRAYVEDFKFTSNTNLLVKVMNSFNPKEAYLNIYSKKGSYIHTFPTITLKSGNYLYKCSDLVKKTRGGRLDFHLKGHKIFSINLY